MPLQTTAQQISSSVSNLLSSNIPLGKHKYVKFNEVTTGRYSLGTEAKGASGETVKSPLPRTYRGHVKEKDQVARPPPHAADVIDKHGCHCSIHRE